MRWKDNSCRCTQLLRYSSDQREIKVWVRKLLTRFYLVTEGKFGETLPICPWYLLSGLMKVEKFALVLLSRHQQNLFCGMQADSELSYCSQNCTFWIRYLFLASSSFLIVTSEGARSSGTLFHVNGNTRWFCFSCYCVSPTWQITINETNSVPSKQNPSRWETWPGAWATLGYPRQAPRRVMVISKTLHVWAVYRLGSEGVSSVQGVR